MICPRPHCGGLLVMDDGEHVCIACARRWTMAQLRDAIRMASTALAAGATTAPEATSTRDRLTALLADDLGDELSDEDEEEEEEEEDRPMARVGWTEARRRKFAATMAAKRGERAPKPRGRPPSPPSRPNGGVFDGAQDGVPWGEWKRDWIERLVEAETKMAAKLEAVRELKAKVDAL